MKIKNMYEGALVYLKTYEEAQCSKYFMEIDSFGDIIYLDNNCDYTKERSLSCGGRVVRIERVCSDGDISYRDLNDELAFDSRHSFRKVTADEKQKYLEEQQ